MIFSKMIVYSSRRTLMASRQIVGAFSTTCEPALKLKVIFEEYRREHYSQETHHRFRQEVIKASCKKDATKMQADELNNILVNIGRPMLTESELDVLCQEVGTTDRSIPVDQLIHLM